MIILKILGIILALIFCLILFVLFCPVNIRLWSDENKQFKFAVKILFININNQKEKSPEKETTENKKKDNLFKNYIKKYGFTETISRFFEISADALRELSFVLHRAKFKKFHITIICASEDASKTALSYGRICSVIYPFTVYIDKEFRVSKNAFDVNIGCNFNVEKPDYGFDFEVSLLSFSAVVTAIRLFRKYKKLF